MISRILECNVDDVSKGGVYSLVHNVIQHNTDQNKIIDIASIAEFEDQADIEELKKYNCSVFFVGSKKSKLLRFLNIYRQTKKLIHENKYDYVHIHSDTSYTVFPFLMLARNSGVKKIIVHSHAAGLDGSHRMLKLLLHKLFKSYISRNSTCLVACSDVAGKWMFTSNVQDNVKIINNGIKLEDFVYNATIRKKIRNELSFDGKLVIGNVGRFAFQKNHAFLINVFKEVHKEIPEALLLLIGEGPLEVDLKKMVKDNGLTNSVAFYGTSTRVNELLQAMDIFALTSYFEGLPIAGVEAQAAGLPTIFSNKITRSAALIKNCTFLPITDSKGNIEKWVNKIKEYSSVPREDTRKTLENEGFSIKETVNAFLDLYN